MTDGKHFLKVLLICAIIFSLKVNHYSLKAYVYLTSPYFLSYPWQACRSSHMSSKFYGDFLRRNCHQFLFKLGSGRLCATAYLIIGSIMKHCHARFSRYKTNCSTLPSKQKLHCSASAAQISILIAQTKSNYTSHNARCQTWNSGYIL